MNCTDIKRLIHAYIDAELDIDTSVEIERHLRQCTACAQLIEQQNQWRLLIESNAVDLYQKAPAKLSKNVRSALREADRAGAKPFAISWRTGGVGIALVLSAIVIGNVAPLFGIVSNQDRLGNEVISSHVRSLMADHVFDVASSDEHTVKPWFNGKLDFSPPVHDFSAQGFTLVGGRLDYVSNRSVAAMVYRHEQHFINLFAWPASPANPANDTAGSNIENRSSQGYSVFNWTQAGMNYWVVSDLNRDKLQEFVRLLKTPAR